MTAITVKVDTVLHVFYRTGPSGGTSIGHQSKFTSEVHPGSNKKIEGWVWDERTWPTDLEEKALALAPSAWDPSTAFTEEEDYQSGHGDGDDLLVQSIEEEPSDNKTFWTPRINHGHLYVHDQEWYLFSEDLRQDDLFINQLASGTLQYRYLNFVPKPGIPIYVRQYKWDTDRGRYSVNLDLKKRDEFTGLLVSGEREDTVDDNGIIYTENLDLSEQEFIVQYEDNISTAKIVLNDNYNEVIGTSGNFSSLDIIGISDGTTNEYRTTYSPIDPSGVIHLIVWDNVYSGTLPWSRIDSYEEFAEGASYQYKLDTRLGILSFGDYDPVTGSGNGLIPSGLFNIALAYTAGLAAEYEPINSRDWAAPRTADANPLNNSFSAGFIKATSTIEEPVGILLEADLTEESDSQYLVEMSNTPASLIATVTDRQGNPLEGQVVSFQLRPPYFGLFTNLERTISAVTGTDGKAYAYFAPPNTIEDIGKATDTLSFSGANTVLEVDDLLPTDELRDVFLFKVTTTDPTVGIPPETVNTFYQDFLSQEDITKDTPVTSATVDKEILYRQTHNLPEAATYDPNDIVTGTKLLVVTTDATAIDPRWGIQKSDVIVPLAPSIVTNIGTEDDPILRATFAGVLPSPDDQFKSYFLVSKAKTYASASIVHETTRRRINSNEISLEITVPPEGNGLYYVDSVNTIQSGLLQRVKNVLSLSDDWINTTSGELIDEYKEDRLGYAYSSFEPLVVDSGTVALYHLDGTLEDSGPNNIGIQPEVDPFDGIFSAPLGGFIDGGYYSQEGYLMTTVTGELWNAIDWRIGTLDVMYRADDPLASGFHQNFGYLVGNGVHGGNFLLAQWRINLEGREGLSLRYRMSGSDNEVNRSYIPDDLGLHLFDGAWHQLRFTWEYQGHWAQSGIIDLRTYFDGIELDDSGLFVGTSSGIVPTPINEPIIPVLEKVADNSLSSYPVYYDEIHWSKMLRSGEFEPIEIFSGESYVDWFRRTRKADSLRLGLTDVLFSGTEPAKLPLGFRLKDSNYTVASMIDRLTFLDPNSYLTSGYFDN